MGMTLDLSRWQFGITTVFHFIFVPLTIGLALLLAIMQTAAYRTRFDDDKHRKWEAMTVFWRRLFLINFAIGVVTGIVQEFQFGMNWAAYSRYVGSVFGAPLAIEALTRILPGIDIPGCVDLRSGSSFSPHPSGLDLAREHRHHAVRLFHPGRQRLDAAPGRRQDRR